MEFSKNFEKSKIEVTMQDVNFVNGVGEGQAIVGFTFKQGEVETKVKIYMAQGMTKMQAIEKIKEERIAIVNKQADARKAA